MTFTTKLVTLDCLCPLQNRSEWEKHWEPWLECHSCLFRTEVEEEMERHWMNLRTGHPKHQETHGKQAVAAGIGWWRSVLSQLDSRARDPWEALKGPSEGRKCWECIKNWAEKGQEKGGKESDTKDFSNNFFWFILKSVAFIKLLACERRRKEFFFPIFRRSY